MSYLIDEQLQLQRADGTSVYLPFHQLLHFYRRKDQIVLRSSIGELILETKCPDNTWFLLANQTKELILKQGEDFEELREPEASGD